MEILKANEFHSNIEQADFQSLVIRTYWEDLGVDLIERQPPGGGTDPCRGYKLGLSACSAAAAICFADVVKSCWLAGPFYPECAAAGLFVCGGTTWLCVEGVDEAYPSCVPKGKIRINPWIGGKLDNTSVNGCE
jgi:hypothetical protein